MRAARWHPVWLAVIVCAVLVGVIAVRASGDTQSSPVWADEFTGAAGSAPNPSIWGYQVGGDGWGNDELECYTDDRSTSALDGKGDLVITANNTPGRQCSDGTTRDYTSARLVTANKRTLQYGHIRVRAELPGAPGMWPAIWAVGADPAVKWPHSGEIDIDEKVGSNPTVANGTIHGAAAEGTPYDIGGTTGESGVSGSTFHVYGVDWTPDSIDFSLDGRVYFTATKSTVESQGAEWDFDKPFFVILNLAVGGSWPGSPTAATTWPQRMIVDYVRVTS